VPGGVHQNPEFLGSPVAGTGMPRRWIYATRTIGGKGVAQQQQQQHHYRVVINKTRSILLLSLLLILLLRFRNFSSLRFEDVVFLPEEEKEVKEFEVDQSDKVVIFYNLFVGNESDIPRIRTLVQDQFRYWKATRHDGIHVTSIGVNVSSLLSGEEGEDSFFPRTLPVHRVTYEPTGWEMLTLDALWAYCQDQPSATVAYLHSKGSFHPKPQNEILRQVLTKAVLSPDCFDHVTTAMPTTTNGKNSTTLCNTCSFRMSPFPHQHTPGNMWLARCHYVRQLLRPSVFAERMESYRPWVNESTNEEHCVGLGRFAAEHWLHTHPYNIPCDLYRPDKYVWGYAGLPVLEEIDLPKWNERHWQASTAPRFNKAKFQRKSCVPMYNISRVLDQFQGLYRLTPAYDWWGWNWYKDSEASAAVVATKS
jgi:hypothetical protein